jgi:hypothetical protein
MSSLQTVAATAADAAAPQSYLLHPLDHLALTVAVIIVAAVLAFAVPVALGRRNAPHDAVARGEAIRREPNAAWAVDRALRVLVDACARDGVGFPGALTVTMGPAAVSAALARPTVAPPAPFLTPPDGRVWSAPMDLVQRYPLDDAPSDEFATAVALGSSEAGLVVADLRRVHGIVAIGGDRGARRAVARRIVDQIVTNPWSASTDLITVGLRDDEVPAGRTMSVRDALAAVTTPSTRGVVVFGKLPSGQDGTDLLAALEAPGNRWGVVVLAAAQDARWQLTAHTDGRLTSEVLGELRWADLALSASAPVEAVVTPVRRVPGARRAAGRRAAGAEELTR